MRCHWSARELGPKLSLYSDLLRGRVCDVTARSQWELVGFLPMYFVLPLMGTWRAFSPLMKPVYPGIPVSGL